MSNASDDSRFKVLYLRCTNPERAETGMITHPDYDHCAHCAARYGDTAYWRATAHQKWSVWREEFARSGSDSALAKMLQAVTLDNPPER